MGFGAVRRIGSIYYDWALLSAWVERWRTETHTFHLPIGAATITLQDVEVILGVPVDGRPVSGRFQRPVVGWEQYFVDFYGFEPPRDDIKGSRIMHRSIISHVMTPLSRQRRSTFFSSVLAASCCGYLEVSFF